MSSLDTRHRDLLSSHVEFKDFAFKMCELSTTLLLNHCTVGNSSDSSPRVQVDVNLEQTPSLDWVIELIKNSRDYAKHLICPREEKIKGPLWIVIRFEWEEVRMMIITLFWQIPSNWCLKIDHVCILIKPRGHIYTLHNILAAISLLPILNIYSPRNSQPVFPRLCPQAVELNA